MHTSHQNSNHPSLCRIDGHTCGACCWGPGIERSQLVTRLRRQRRLFRGVSAVKTIPGRFRLFLHEVLATRGINLLWAVQMRLPWIGKRRKSSIAQSIVCPFMGFDDDQENSVGCMLHPTRFEEQDVRSAVAFALLPGISCGDANYICTGCTRFNEMPADQTLVFLDAVGGQDWYEYTRTIRAFSCTAIVSQPNHTNGIGTGSNDV